MPDGVLGMESLVAGNVGNEFFIVAQIVFNHFQGIEAM